MRRNLFTEDHEAFRALAREFIEQEVVPAYPEWEKAGRMPRNVFKQMGALGILGMAIPEEYGGAGMPDYRYNVVLQEDPSHADRQALFVMGTNGNDTIEIRRGSTAAKIRVFINGVDKGEYDRGSGTSAIARVIVTIAFFAEQYIDT